MAPTDVIQAAGPSLLRRRLARILVGAERVGPVLWAVGTFASWEFLARTGFISPLFFPPPSAIGAEIWRLAWRGEIAPHASATVARVLTGFGLGAGPGLVIGLAMGASPRLRAQLDPLVAATHPVPKIAVLPLILVIFGIGEASKIALAAVGAFFPMLLNAMAGVRQISPVHFEVARSYGAGPIKRLTRVVLPGSLPMVLTGARLALNVALMLTIAGELVAAQEGLGQMIWFAWQIMRIEQVYAGLVIISLVGITFHVALGALGRWVMPWHAGNETTSS